MCHMASMKLGQFKFEPCLFERIMPHSLQSGSKDLPVLGSVDVAGWDESRQCPFSRREAPRRSWFCTDMVDRVRMQACHYLPLSYSSILIHTLIHTHPYMGHKMHCIHRGAHLVVTTRHSCHSWDQPEEPMQTRADTSHKHSRSFDVLPRGAENLHCLCPHPISRMAHFFIWEICRCMWENEYLIP